MRSLGNVHDVGHIRGEFGKERDTDSLPNPPTDVPHQLWILVKWVMKPTSKLKQR